MTSMKYDSDYFKHLYHILILDSIIIKQKYIKNDKKF